MPVRWSLPESIPGPAALACAGSDLACFPAIAATPARRADPTPTLDTLPDYLGPGLRIAAVGLNPSPRSAALGYYFAHPRNRFWPALNASRLVRRPLEPSPDAMQTLLERERIGFTDVVKRVTASGSDLRAVDYRAGAPRLADKLLGAPPGLLWFQGKVPFTAFCRYVLGRRGPFAWGPQPFGFEAIPLYVTPNPSPANAAWSLADITRAMNAVADYAAARR